MQKENNEIVNNNCNLDNLNNKSIGSLKKASNRNSNFINETSTEFDCLICIENIKKGKWQDKKENIEKIIKHVDKNLDIANSNKVPLNDIMMIIGYVLKEKIVRVKEAAIELIKLIITKIEDDFNKNYLCLISKELINNLNDNNNDLRKIIIETIMIVLSYDNIENFILELIESLKINKVNLRFEILTILCALNANKKMNKNYFNILVEKLIYCMQDKQLKIRNLTEELILNSLKYFNNKIYYNKVKQLYQSNTQQMLVTNKLDEIFGVQKNLQATNNTVTEQNCPVTVDNAQLGGGGVTKNKKKIILKLADTDGVGEDIHEAVKRCKSNDILPRNKKTIKKDTSEKKNKLFDFKNAFKKFTNFHGLKKTRFNRDIKLNLNFYNLYETSKNGNLSDVKPLSQIFNEDFIKNYIIDTNNDLNLILTNFISILNSNNFKEDVLPNIDLLLKFIVRNIDFNLKNNNDFFINYFEFYRILFENLKLVNSNLNSLEDNIILNSFIFLNLYFNDQYPSKIKKIITDFYRMKSIDKTFSILFEIDQKYYNINVLVYSLNLFYEDLISKNQPTQNIKKIINLLNLCKNNENVKSNIDIYNELKSVITKIFNYIINEYGVDKFREDIFSKLNKNEKNLCSTIFDISIYEEQENKVNNNNIYSKKKVNNLLNNINNNTIKLNSNLNSNVISFGNNNNSYSDYNKKEELFIKDNPNNPTISNKDEDKKTISESIEVSDKEDIIELLKELTSEGNYENYIKKLNYIQIVKDLLSNKNNYNKNKKYLLECKEIIIRTLLFELQQNLTYKKLSNKTYYIDKTDQKEYIYIIFEIFRKIAKNKEIVLNLNEEIINKMFILFFNYLQIDTNKSVSFNLDILQKINEISVRFLMNIDRSIMIISLLKLISNFQNDSDIAKLGINCLINLIKETKFLINKIDIESILTLIIIEVNDINLITSMTKIKIHELFIKTIKKLLNAIIIDNIQNFNNIQVLYKKIAQKYKINDIQVDNWLLKIYEHNNSNK